MTDVKFKIIVYSIPKSGTHLVSDILALMYKPDCNIYSKEDMYSIISHQIHYKFIDRVTTIGISTHPNYIPYDIIKNFNVQKIFVIRHPLDIAISRYYYNEERIRLKNRRSIFKFVSDILPIVIKQIKDHINEFKENPNSLLLTFENIVLNKEEVIKKIANFTNINLTNSQMEEIKRKTSFDEVHKKEKDNGIYDVGKKQPNVFHRSGKTKQWIKEFSLNQYNSFIKLIPKEIMEIINV